MTLTPLALAFVLPNLCSGGGSDEGPPTFARDVAPIVFERCSVCHHPDGGAPFSLLHYEDVRKRAQQIARVTGERFMPPWLPDSSCNRFREDRSLTAAQIETLREWAEAGAPEGDSAELPPTPVYKEGWQGGEPDQVATMAETFTVPAEGRDVHRDFVIQPQVQGTRYVRAVEFQPDNPSVLHHAILFIDGSGVARAQDRKDAEPGYPAMGLGSVRVPDGQFVCWTPGKGPIDSPEGVAWRLDEHFDIVVQMHLRPTGKPEPIRLALGLWFADAPPTRHPMAIRLLAREIDIPAGQRDYLVENSYQLPVDVQVLLVYPHAHYLATDMKAWAELPDGSERWLIRIPRWDFNWQEEYSYEEPLLLPRGTVLRTRYVYDNSAENPFNPTQPPKRVRLGIQSDDEMGELLLQVLPSEADRPLLWRDFMHTTYRLDLAKVERSIAERPTSANLREDALKYCLRLGWNEQAVAHGRGLVDLLPGRGEPLQRLAQGLLALGDAAGALETAQRAVALEPDGRGYFLLARALEQSGRTAEASHELERLLERDRKNFQAHTSLGEILARAGKKEEARRHFLLAIESNPECVRALWNLARLELELGRTADALDLCARALDIAPDEAGAQHVLGLALRSQGRSAEALVHLELAATLEPEEPEFQRDLADAREVQPSR